MKRFAATCAAAALTAVLAQPAAAMAAINTQTTSIAVDPANLIQMQVTADCAQRAEQMLVQHRRQPADARRADRVPRRRMGAPDHHAAQFGPTRVGGSLLQRTFRHAEGDQGRQPRQRAVEDCSSRPPTSRFR